MSSDIDFFVSGYGAAGDSEDTFFAQGAGAYLRSCVGEENAEYGGAASAHLRTDGAVGIHDILQFTCQRTYGKDHFFKSIVGAVA